jgi:hypothetical protein
MITSSGLSLFYGPDTLITTLSGEVDGRLYGSTSGDYIYKSGVVYQITFSGVDPIYNGYAGGMTTVGNIDLIGTPFYPYQQLKKRVGQVWENLPNMPSGICNYLLSDDGDTMYAIPVLTGNISITGNRIDKIITLSGIVDSDTGLPQTTDIALITDLEAAI